MPLNEKLPMANLPLLYIKKKVRLHGVQTTIVFNRYLRFSSRLWQTLQEAMGSNLRMSLTYQTHGDGQSESTI